MARGTATRMIGAGLAAAIFLVIFCFLAWGAYQNVWRDVKH